MSKNAEPQEFPQILEGIRVLECSVYIAGPLAGSLLGDLGADVIKVEPKEGEVSSSSSWGYTAIEYAGNFNLRLGTMIWVRSTLHSVGKKLQETK